MNKKTLIVFFLAHGVWAQDRGEKTVIDLGSDEIRGRVKRPQVKVIQSSEASLQVAERLAKEKLIEIEQRYLNLTPTATPNNQAGQP